ncbi:MAG: hypothetical protein ACRD2W_25425 [Acidimicrobiales bacterium]
MRSELAGWAGFAAWAGAGALCGFAGVSLASVGLLILPLAVVALIAAGRRARPWPEVAGFLPGLGTGAGLFVGLVNLGSSPCPSSGSASVGPGAATSSYSCGGLDPVPWLVGGAILVVLGFAVYLAQQR